MYALLRGNPLLFPIGRNPGVDPLHPASTGLLFSGVAARGGAGCFTSLITGASGTPNGSPGFVFDSRMGPALGCTTNSNVVFSPFPSLLNSPIALTGAWIFKYVGNTANPQYAFNDNAAGANGFGVSNGGLYAYIGGTGLPQGGSIALTAGVTYFIAMSAVKSASGNATVYLVATRLDTGTITTGSITGSIGASAGDGNLYIGNRGTNTRQLDGNLAALMVSNRSLSASQLLAWAADPWAFWYPYTMLQTLDFLSTPVSGVTPFVPLPMNPGRMQVMHYPSFGSR